MVHDTQPLHVLLVEDNVVNQQVALALLKRRGHITRVAATGVEALKAWGLDRYNVILMDIQMPEMDGLEATRRIRALEGSDHHTPIIAVTARTMASDREECLAAGMDAYVSKPIRAPELMEAIDRLTSRSWTVQSALDQATTGAAL